METVLCLFWLTSVVFAQISVDNVDEPVTAKIILVDTQYLTQDASLFGGPIGVNTEYLTEENGITKWIGVNTEYLTQITATATDQQGSPVITTQDVRATIIGNPPVNGVLGADLSVVVTPAFLSEVNSIKADLCLTKKRALACSLDFVDKVAASFDIYAAAEAAKWGVGVGGISAVGAMYAAQAKKIAEGGKDIPLKMDIKKEDFNKAKPVITKIITMTKSGRTTTTSSSTGTGAAGGSGKGGPTATAIAGECWLYTGSNPDTLDIANPDGDTTGNGDEGPPAKIRRLAGRITYDDSMLNVDEITNVNGISQSRNPAIIAKRGDLTHLGSCPDALPSDFKQILGYPGVKDVTDDTPNRGLPHGMWWFIPQPHGDTKLCTIYTLQQVPRDKLQNNLPLGYDQSFTSPARKVSLDHIYEKSFIKDFFNSVFTNSDDPRCKPFMDMFLQKTKYTDPKYPRKRQYSRLQTLFFLAPNRENGAFAGLDQNINAIKGSLMNPGLGGIQAIDTRKEIDATDKNLNLWNDIAMAWSVLKIPVVQAKFKQINTDVYRAFLAFDELQSCEPIKGVGDSLFPQTWASAYQDWMTSFLRQRQDETIKYVASITSAIEAAPSTTTNPGGNSKNMYGHAFDALAAQFPEDFYQLDTAALLDFSGEPLDKIQKRDIIGFPECSTANAALPTNLPKLPTTVASKPTFTPPQPPTYTGGARPEFQLQCVNKHMSGVRSVDRRIATDAINLGCGSPIIVSPVDKFNMSKTGYQDGIRSNPSQYVHMTHKWSENQDGCQPRVLDPQLKGWGIDWDDCQGTMKFILDNCDTNTVTEKYGGAVRWNSPAGCIDLTLWSPDGPDLAPY